MIQPNQISEWFLQLVKLAIAITGPILLLILCQTDNHTHFQRSTSSLMFRAVLVSLIGVMYWIVFDGDHISPAIASGLAIFVLYIAILRRARGETAYAKQTGNTRKCLDCTERNTDLHCQGPASHSEGA